MPKKTWMYLLFGFSALFFVLATYSLILMFTVPAAAGHFYLLYRVVAGYFLAVVLYVIASQKRKKLKHQNRRIFK